MPLASIMIIDDNSTDRYLLKRIIEKSKIADKVFEADNGKAALDFLSDFKKNVKENPGTFPPMLIFLDINMPIMGGFEFLEKYSELEKETSQYSSIVFTMLTSSGSEEDKKKALSYNCVKGFITKGRQSMGEFKEMILNHFPDID